ncbi:PQQ-binding-like beta-propeller repeat protein [Mycolicibacterium sediminis]|uniref:Pyrrolo-quinoline quinone repeat domain-containing protein n=1 Tax=Mycolicibacterium sediminis TaxID=1286180 RepID=A0A7I7QM00_9MYCO|nr:PQQ-binding-like beta-propeller repeat protein [Mycolicibacterium sediminis]BBY27027.1 hypothetical protein MSEDJ_11230 [Mycolicibacterium sediminis]
MSPRVLTRRSKIALAIAVTAAVVIGVVVFTSGSDESDVDATTSEPTEVPAVPAILGDERFDLLVSDRSDATAHVLAGGPGFAVAVDGGLTAYGADGVERWHYRPADTAVTDVHAYDDGTVLIAALSDNLVAFDANTGIQLWTSQSKDVRGAFAGYQNSQEEDPAPALARQLAQSTGTVMMAFDPRTGDEKWRQSRGCSSTAYTPRQLLCLNGFDGGAGVTVVDAATGSAGVDIVATVPGASYPSSRVVSSGGGVALAFGIRSSQNRQNSSQVIYLDTTSRAIVPLGDASVTGGDPRGDLLVSTRLDRSSTVALHDVAGTQRCAFAPDVAPSYDGFGVTAWLTDQIISVVNRGSVVDPESSLAVLDRDCRSVAAPPVSDATEITDIVPVPGATLMVRGGDDGIHVVGYSPR